MDDEAVGADHQVGMAGQQRGVLQWALLAGQGRQDQGLEEFGGQAPSGTVAQEDDTRPRDEEPGIPSSWQ
ncbi:hypothetical protein GCM10010365_45270 [Streptomyces poonensis]|uniref:Uncharacterized protein n=1 Tax=Streptomyces poonensis TaxID=68255 RepID=A0A918ULZ9_9ACTN|nr:hypothetical protein GCM10010365_45270 [Streptomyces poonensis]